jgi:signal transduction histidine kinase/ActR/RegA family two-component response regulator
MDSPVEPVTSPARGSEAPSPTSGAPSLDTALSRDQQLRFLETLLATLAGCANEQAIYSAVVHRVAAAFHAEASCLAAYEPVTGTLEIVHQARAKRIWPMELLGQAVLRERIISDGDLLAVPIICESGLWGVLAVAWPSREADTEGTQAYTSSDRLNRLPRRPQPAQVLRQTLRSAAERIASELDRRRMHLLEDVLDSLLRKTKPIDVYTHTLRELRRFIRYDHSASVLTMQRGMAQIIVRVEKLVRQRGETETLVDSPRRGRSVRLTAPQTRYLSRLQQPIRLTHDQSGWRLPEGGTHADAAGLWRVLWPDTGSHEGAILCYPLIFGGQALGYLCLTAKRQGAFDPTDRSPEGYPPLLNRFARLLSVTLYRSELYHQSDRQLQAIKEIGRAITTPMPVEEVCRQVLKVALRALHVQVGAVGLLTKQGELELVAHQGCTLAQAPVLKPGQGIAGTVVQTGRSWAVPDVKRESAYVVFNHRVCSELVAPIVYDREVIGILDVESFEEGRFREEDAEVITFLEALANQGAIAIKTAQLRSEAMELLGTSKAIDSKLSTAGLQDLLVDELRATIDRLATANRAKSEFLAHMSHDLRGPLNVIVGLSNLLTDPAVAATLDPEKQQESLRLIRSNGEVLGSLIGNILDLSVLEAGKMQLTVAPFDARPAFDYLGAVAKTLAEESHKELDISVTVDPTITSITADEEKFLRVAHNLIANAIKFTPSGGSVSVTAAADGGGERLSNSLHITVSDTGIGIAPVHHLSIFQAFEQANGLAYRQYHGSGLGLAVVRQLVELHGGRVWVESVPGEGSTFHVVLPNALVRPRLDPASSLAGSGSALDDGQDDVRARETRTVLVVEDIPAHMSVMRLAVTSRGYTMHGVGSGEEALAWLTGHRADVILLDMQLPGSDGFSVAARIKGQLETHSIPVIAVTADALSVSEERARASGCDAYLTKPVDIAALHDTIDAVMSRKI